jgi:hypothetical protein
MHFRNLVILLCLLLITSKELADCISGCACPKRVLDISVGAQTINLKRAVIRSLPVPIHKLDNSQSCDSELGMSIEHISHVGEWAGAIFRL